MLIIDSHAHLWLKQDTVVDGKKIKTIDRGRSIFMGEERQMLPPFLINGRNSAEIMLSNMDYAQVAGAVITQEFIDGCQNRYLKIVQDKYPTRFKVCGLIDSRRKNFDVNALSLISQGFPGLALPAHRCPTGNDRFHLNSPEMIKIYKAMERHNVFFSLCLAPGDSIQVAEMEEALQECPSLKVAIGHFGMPTYQGWELQIMLARHKHVMIESGGITWLYNSEFYPYPSAIKVIKEAAEMVGYEHLMWGSDYPRTITAITYKMSYDFIVKSKEITDYDKSLLLGLNAKEFYGFKNLPELPYIKNMSE